MALFGFLEGLSPWWWIAFGITLGAVEMASMSFFLIWPAIAALITGAFLWVAPDSSGAMQVTVFAVGAVVLTFLGRSLLHRLGDGGEENDSLNARGNLMVGRQAQVLSFSGPEGRVIIDDIRWRAIWPEGATSEPGAQVKIERADGMTLHVRPQN